MSGPPKYEDAPLLERLRAFVRCGNLGAEGSDILEAVAEIERLRKALEGLVYFSEDDFPVGLDGKRRWECYCTTAEYAAAFRAALEALGRDAT